MKLEHEADAIEQTADLIRHLADGGNIEYCYTDLVGNHAGPPARWWPLPIDFSLGSRDVTLQLNGSLNGEPVIYRKVDAPVVRYAVADADGLIGAYTANEDVALRWLKGSSAPGARIVKLVETDYKNNRRIFAC